MQEELSQIDTSTIDELRRLKEGQEILESRLARMEDRRSDVSPAVFARVRSDYETRQSALEEEARPLKERARAEYARLADCDRQISEALEAARLDKEELSFRNDLGEFEEDDFRGRMEQAEETLRQREADQEASRALKERFFEAFHSEEELTAEPALTEDLVEASIIETPTLETGPSDGHSEESVSEEAAEAAVDAKADGDGDGDGDGDEADGDEADGHPMEALQELSDFPLDGAVVLHGPSGANGNATRGALQEALDNDETIPTGRARPVLVPDLPPPPQVAAAGDPPKESEVTAELPVPDPPTFEAAAASSADASMPDLPISSAPMPDAPMPDAPAATVIARRARLLVELPDEPSEEYLLSMSQLHTSIGRSPGSTISIDGDGISGHHAEIVFSPEGFTLHDLKSLGGTFVNGEKVARHLLTDGDVIRVGAAQLAFRNF